MSISFQKLTNSPVLHTVLLMLLLLISTYLYVVHPAARVLWDFNVFYEVGQGFAKGISPYLERVPIEVENHQKYSLYYFYPPFLAWLMSFFSIYQLSSVQWGWCIVNFLSWLAGGVLLSAVAAERSEAALARPAWLLITLFLVFCFEPVYIGSREGQVNGIIFFLLVGFLYCLNKRLDYTGGVCLALAAMIKMSPALLILIPLRHNRWRTIVTFGVVSAILAVLPGLNFDIFILYTDFFKMLKKLGSESMVGNYIFNFAVDLALTAPFGLSDSTLLRSIVKACLLLGGLSWWLKERRDIVYDTVFLIAVMVIISPVLWFHHLGWLMPAVIVLLARNSESGRAGYRYFTYVIGLYFLLSQIYFLHIYGLLAGGSAAWLTRLLPFLCIVLLLWMLTKFKPALPIMDD